LRKALFSGIFPIIMGHVHPQTGHRPHLKENSMTTHKVTVEDGVVVGLEYVLTLDDGEVIDSSSEDDLLWYLHGAGQIIPGLEQALTGLQVGDTRKVVVEPEDAYGEFDEEALQYLPREMFPEDLEEDMELELHDEETDEVMEAMVVEITDDEVLLDFNHPLAGHQLTFQVRIAEVRPATEEELDHGHAHPANGHVE
jgi:FKBP-type peptidyl-prolyl cis-trans isomerase SlyD